MGKTISLEEARDRLSQLGMTRPDIARRLKVDVTVVKGVLNGRLKGNRGDAHKVAVALGLKNGTIVPDDMPIADAMRAAG